MIKDLLKELKGIMLDAIEETEIKDLSTESKHKRAAIIFNKYDDKTREPEFDKKLTDTQRERLQAIYETATKGIKEVIEEVEKGISSEKSPNEKPKFKVGQRVQFKTWEEMEKEFGIGADGGIKCKCGFIEEMKPLCGTWATITEIDDKHIRLDEFSSDAGHAWILSVDMLKAVR